MKPPAHLDNVGAGRAQNLPLSVGADLARDDPGDSPEGAKAAGQQTCRTQADQRTFPAAPGDQNADFRFRSSFPKEKKHPFTLLSVLFYNLPARSSHPARGSQKKPDRDTPDPAEASRPRDSRGRARNT